MNADTLARRFHELYEELAPSHGYETRVESRKPWADVPEQNKALMTAVCMRILGELASAPSVPQPDIERAIARLTALRNTLRSTPVPGIEATLDGVIGDLTCAPRVGSPDPITAAVDAELDPLKDA